MDKLRTKGFIHFCTVFTDMLLTKKKVALFTDYKEAKDQIVFELIAHNDKEQAEGIHAAIKLLEENTDCEEFWQEL